LQPFFKGAVISCKIKLAMESKTRIIFNIPNFWADKPIQKRHPKYVKKTK
jgi:hypothetical protein